MAFTSTARLRSRPAARLRPGERPGWWDADSDRPSFEAWRAAAATHAVGVDALVAVLIEFDLVLADLRTVDEQATTLIRSVLCADASVSRLSVGGPWRGWLAPGSEPYAFDELPELVLPERLIARLTPGCALTPRIHLGDAGLALDCDRRAARQGRTLESWVLRAALRGALAAAPESARAPLRL